MTERVTVVGGGLAGCEATWQLAQAGVPVSLVEMKPIRRTPAQKTDALCELVCSNSLRSTNLLNAVGLLKDEMRRLDSLIIGCARLARVPAGDALAVDRVRFSTAIDDRLANHPLVERRTEIVTRLPPEADGHAIIATGPLTADELAADIVSATGSERLYFYDALAPIVSGDTIEHGR